MNDQRILKTLQALEELTKTAGDLETTKIIPNCEVVNSTPSGMTGYIIVKNELGYYTPAVKVAGITYSNGDFVNLLLIKGTEPIAFQHGSNSDTGGYWPFQHIIHVTDETELIAAIAAAGLNDIILVDNDIEVSSPISITSGVAIAGFGVSGSFNIFRETGRVFTITDTFESQVTFQNLTIRSDFLNENEELIYIENSDVEFIHSRLRAPGAENAAIIRVLMDATEVELEPRNLDLIYSDVLFTSGGSPAYAIYANNTVFASADLEIQVVGGRLQAPDFILHLDDCFAFLQLPTLIDSESFSLSGTGDWSGSYMNSSGGIVSDSVDLNGVADALILDGDADTSISSPTDDQIDFEAGGVDIARITSSGVSLPNIGDDFFAHNDIYALFNRLINYGFSPDEHWRQNVDELAWVGYTAYTGFGTPDSIATTNSIYRIAHSTGNLRGFRYRAASTGANIYLRARVSLTQICQAGLMIDDGNGNADGEGANNLCRIFISQASTGAAIQIVTEYRAGGAGITTTTFTPEIPPSQFIGIGINTLGTLWTSWQFQPFLFGESGERLILATLPAVNFTWTPVRVGLYSRFTSTNATRKALFDWYDEATA